MMLDQLQVTDFSGQPQAQYAVKRIICIGRNYADHAQEMGHDPAREPPFYFFKPLTALAPHTGKFILPKFSQNVQHELEMVIAIKGQGYNLTIDEAKKLVGGFGLGLDMTCRDLQAAAKKAGRPWDQAKGFDQSAPCTPIVAGQFDDIHRLAQLRLRLNDQIVQTGHWQKMIWPIPELIAEVSRYTRLQTGDIIFTGTPAGVGPVKAGDRLKGELVGLPHHIDLTVAAEA